MKLSSKEQALLTFEGFEEHFLELRKNYSTYTEAYEAAESKHEELFGMRKYSDYVSFATYRAQRRRKLKQKMENKLSHDESQQITKLIINPRYEVVEKYFSVYLFKIAASGGWIYNLETVESLNEKLSRNLSILKPLCKKYSICDKTLIDELALIIYLINNEIEDHFDNDRSNPLHDEKEYIIYMTKIGKILEYYNETNEIEIIIKNSESAKIPRFLSLVVRELMDKIDIHYQANKDNLVKTISSNENVNIRFINGLIYNLFQYLTKNKILNKSESYFFIHEILNQPKEKNLIDTRGYNIPGKEALEKVIKRRDN